jgi:cell wall-associated NlpC family hydrolase
MTMPHTERLERDRVVQAARTFLGTPYHHNGLLKGIGVDCATILILAFNEAKVVAAPVDVPPYSPQWHLHHEENKYTDFIRKFAAEVDRSPLPGDIVVWKFHRAFAHGGIVTEWPHVIHAFIGRGVFEDDAEANQMLSTISERVPDQGKPRPMKVFSVWGH